MFGPVPLASHGLKEGGKDWGSVLIAQTLLTVLTQIADYCRGEEIPPGRSKFNNQPVTIGTTTPI